MRVLVLTLKVDEPQFDNCKASVVSQRGVMLEHRVFEGLSGYESAVALYESCYQARKEFDYFIKLDADMVFDHESVVLNLIRLHESHNLTRITIPVLDHISQTFIRGLHVIKAGCIDSSYHISPKLRDNWISGLEGRMIWTRNEKYRVNHAPHFSDFQSFTYGFNRGQKTRLEGVRSPSYESLYDLFKCKNMHAIRGFMSGLCLEVDSFDHASIQKHFAIENDTPKNGFLRTYYQISGSFFASVFMVLKILNSKIRAKIGR